MSSFYGLYNSNSHYFVVFSPSLSFPLHRFLFLSGFSVCCILILANFFSQHLYLSFSLLIKATVQKKTHEENSNIHLTFDYQAHVSFHLPLSLIFKQSHEFVVKFGCANEKKFLSLTKAVNWMKSEVQTTTYARQQVTLFFRSHSLSLPHFLCIDCHFPFLSAFFCVLYFVCTWIFDQSFH